MDKYTQERRTRQVSRVRKYRQQLLEGQDLCFTNLLPKEQVEAAITRHQVRFRERLYTPLVTIWTFLYQVLAPDQSCRAAVARLLALLCLAGEGLASATTGAYCKARQRLSEPLVADLARCSGRDLHHQIPTTGLLKGRPIKIGDGTTVSMPDTPANQKAYPQQPGQKKGLGFPILRLVGLISLSCGAVVNVAMAPYSGKRTGETSLLRQLLDYVHAGGHPAGGRHLFQLLDDCLIVGSRGGHRHPTSQHTKNRLSHGPATGALRSYRPVVSAATPRMDE